MIELIYSPKWFYGKDILIDIISIFVLLLISYFSMKYYKINSKNKNYIFFASSFWVIALAFIFKIITNFTLYYNIVQTKHLGLLTVAYNTLQSSNILFSAGFLLYRILMLIGLFMLYSLYAKNKTPNIILTVYFILVLSYFSMSTYYVFHATALIILLIITFQYWKNYKKEKQPNNKWLLYSFLLISLSQILFIFIGVTTLFYVIAELIQLLGYIVLLITFFKVLKYGKKKRTKRYNT